MIQITANTYGHVVGKRVVPVTPNDPPIVLTPAQEQRLVDLGVAKYVDPAVPKEPDNEKTAEELSKMKKRELAEYAEQRGVEIAEGSKKEDIIKNILGSQEIPEEAEPDNEEEEPEEIEAREDEIPTFDAEQAVQ